MNTDSLLAEILAELKRQNANHRLWSAQDIADYLGLSKSTAYGKIICAPGFPKPIKLEGVSRRWKPSEVTAFIERKRAA